MSREMKDSGIEWIGEIPIDWRCCKQKYVITLVNGRAYKDDEFEQDGKYRILRVGNLFTNPVWYTSSLELEDDKYAYDGDLLYAWSMSYAPLIWHGEKVIYHYHIWKAMLSDQLNKKFVYYYLSSLTDSLMAEKHETTMSFVTMNVMNNSYIAFPETLKQEKIADFLDQQCSAIDSVLEKTRASIEEYKKLKQAVITQAVTKGVRGKRPMKNSGIPWLKNIPVEWDAERGKHLFFETNERSTTGEEELLTVSHITGVTPRSMKNVNMFMSESLIDYKICHINDLAANTMWMWQGAIGVSKYEGVISPSYNTYRQRIDAYNPEYLDYLLRIPQLIATYSSYSTGITASRLRLYPQGFFEIMFPVPPKKEQEEIVIYLESKIPAIDNLISKKEQYLTEIENYKKSLIYEYVTGKKEVE